MRNAYLDVLYELAQANEQVLALVADNGAVVYDRYRAQFPNQFINLGISEANMVSVAAGLAACGKIPFAYTISAFLTMRAFEQIRNDVCMQRMNVKLVGIGAGFVYSGLGPTHHATEDIALMRVLPEMTIFSPADPLEARYVTAAAARIDGPVYLRLATGGSSPVYDADYDFAVGKGVTIRDGDDVTIIATGAIVQEAIEAADVLEKGGTSTRVINIHTIKPLDRDIILQAAQQTGHIVAVEEHSTTGGLGSAVAEVIVESAMPEVRCKQLGLNGAFAVGYGSYAQMKEQNGLSKGHIVRAAKALLEA